MKTARDTAIAFGAQTAAFALSIISSVLIARFLGPEGKGILAVLLRVAGASQAFAQWGIQESLLPYMREERDSPQALSGSALALGGILGCGVAVTVIMAYPFLVDNILRGTTKDQLTWIMTSVPITVLGLFLARLVQLRSTLRYNAGQVLAAGLSVSGYAIAFWFWRSDVTAGIVGYMVAQFAALIVYLFLGIRGRVVGLALKFSIVRNLLRSGSTMQIGLVAAYLGTQISVLILNNFANSAEVGLFTTATGVASFLLFFSVAVRLILQTRMVETDKSTDLVDLTVRTTKHTLFWLLLGALGMVLFGHWVITILYGEPFVGAYPMLLLVLPGTVAYGIAQILASYFVVGRQLLFTSVTAVIVVVVNLATLVAFGYGLTGIMAASVQTATSLLWLCMYIVWFVRKTGVAVTFLLPGRTELRYYRVVLRYFLNQVRGWLSYA